MKKSFYTLTLLFAFSILSTAVNANPVLNDKPKTELTTEQKAEIEQITKRVKEIKAMDKSALTKVERRALKNEVKELKRRADFLSQNVTLSLGAIIIILLLLILIL